MIIRVINHIPEMTLTIMWKPVMVSCALAKWWNGGFSLYTYSDNSSLHKESTLSHLLPMQRHATEHCVSSLLATPTDQGQ